MAGGYHRGHTTGSQHRHQRQHEELGHQDVLQQKISGSVRQLPAAPTESDELADAKGDATESIEMLSKIRRQIAAPRRGNRYVGRSPVTGSSASELGDVSPVAHIEIPGDSTYEATSPNSSHPLMGSSSTEKERSHARGKRHKSTQWSDYLSQENMRLRAHASKLEDLLEQAGAGQNALEKELEEAQRHRDELEKLAHEGLVCGNVAATLGENTYLRHQLSAYAVEIDVLRKEKEQLEKRLEEVCDKERMLTEANKKLRGSREEISTALKGANENLEEFKNTSKEQAESYFAEVADKDRRFQKVIDLMECYRDAWLTLQREFVSQTKSYRSFVLKVKEEQLQAAGYLKDCEFALQACRQNSNVFHDLHLALRAGRDIDLPAASMQDSSPQEDRSLTPKADANRTTRLKDLVPETFKYVFLGVKAFTGLVVQKKSNRSGTFSDRRAIVKFQQPVGDPQKRPIVQLRWTDCWAKSEKQPLSVRIKHKYQGNIKIVNLEDVILMDYGKPISSGTTKRKDSFKPWHCITLYTRQRSFDFVCSSDDDTKCLVLVLSRYCTNAFGTVRSCRSFDSSKAWCKIKSSQAWNRFIQHCRHNRMVFAKRILDASHQVAASPIG